MIEDDEADILIYEVVVLSAAAGVILDAGSYLTRAIFLACWSTARWLYWKGPDMLIPFNMLGRNAARGVVYALWFGGIAATLMHFGVLCCLGQRAVASWK